MAIKISVSGDFLSMFVDSINVLDCRLSGVRLLCVLVALKALKRLLKPMC